MIIGNAAVLRGEDSRSCTLPVALFVTRYPLLVYFALTHQDLLSSVRKSYSHSTRTTHLYSTVLWLYLERMESIVFIRESATTGLIDTNEVSELVRIN
jgi:hypothetical protein